jgi:flagellar hook-length control protein FliK
LDANSAREIPAQQQTNGRTGTNPAAPALSLAASILQQVAAQFQGAAAQQNAPQNASRIAAAPQTAAHVTVQAADVLGRMLARAANAEGQPTGAPAPAPTAPTASHGTPSPSQLFARLMSVIAQSSNQQTPSGGEKQSSQFAFGKDALPAAHAQSSNTQTALVPAFSTALSNASAPAAQSAASSAMPYAIDPQSVIEQLVKGISLRNFGTTSEVRMRLQPEHLGDVSLKLTVSGNTITANIVAQNADVRDMLLSNQQQLARTLAEAGLSLGNFSVDVSGGNAGFSQQHTAQQHSLGKTSALHLGSVAEDETWADSRFGPPVMAGSKALVLNYLA